MPRPKLDTGIPGLELPDLLTSRLPLNREVPWTTQEGHVEQSWATQLPIETNYASEPHVSEPLTQEELAEAQAAEDFWADFDESVQPVLAFEPAPEPEAHYYQEPEPLVAVEPVFVPQPAAEPVPVVWNWAPSEPPQLPEFEENVVSTVEPYSLPEPEPLELPPPLPEAVLEENVWYGAEVLAPETIAKLSDILHPPLSATAVEVVPHIVEPPAMPAWEPVEATDDWAAFTSAPIEIDPVAELPPTLPEIELFDSPDSLAAFEPLVQVVEEIIVPATSTECEDSAAEPLSVWQGSPLSELLGTAPPMEPVTPMVELTKPVAPEPVPFSPFLGVVTPLETPIIPEPEPVLEVKPEPEPAPEPEPIQPPEPEQPTLPFPFQPRQTQDLEVAKKPEPALPSAPASPEKNPFAVSASQAPAFPFLPASAADRIISDNTAETVAPEPTPTIRGGADSNPFAQHAAGEREEAKQKPVPVPVATPTTTKSGAGLNLASLAKPKRARKLGKIFRPLAALFVVGGLAAAGYKEQAWVRTQFNSVKSYVQNRMDGMKVKPAVTVKDPRKFVDERWNVSFTLPQGWDWLHAGGENRIFGAASFENPDCRVVARGGVVGAFSSVSNRQDQASLKGVMQQYATRLFGSQAVAVGEQKIGEQTYIVMRYETRSGWEVFRNEPTARVVYQTLKNDALYAFDFAAAGNAAQESVSGVANKFLLNIQDTITGASVAGLSRRVVVNPSLLAKETGLNFATPSADWQRLEDPAPLLPLTSDLQGGKTAWNAPIQAFGQNLCGYRSPEGDVCAAVVIYAPQTHCPEDTPLASLALRHWFPGAQVSIGFKTESKLPNLHGREFHGDIQWEGAPLPTVVRVYRANDYAYLVAAVAGQKDRDITKLTDALQAIGYDSDSLLAKLGTQYVPPIFHAAQCEFWEMLIEKASVEGRKDEAFELCQTAWQNTRSGKILLLLCDTMVAQGQNSLAADTLRNGWKNAAVDCDEMAKLAAFASKYSEPELASELIITALQQDSLGRSAMGIAGCAEVIENLARKKAYAPAIQLAELYYKRQAEPMWKIWEATLLYQQPNTKAAGIELLERWVVGRHTRGLAKQLLDHLKRHNLHQMGLDVADRVLGYERTSPLAWLLKTACLRNMGNELAAEKAIVEAQRMNPKLTSLPEMLTAISGVEAGAILPGQAEKITPVSLPSSIDAKLTAAVSKASTVEASGVGWTYLYRTTALAAAPGNIGRTTYRYAVKIHDAAGMQQFNTLKLKFLPKWERIQLNELKVRNSAGKVITSQVDMQKAFVADKSDELQGIQEKMLVVPVPGLAAGSTVEYAFTREPLVPPTDQITLRHVFGAEAPTALEIIYLHEPSGNLAYHHSRGMKPRVEGSGQYWTELNVPLVNASYYQAPQDKLVPVLWLGERSATWAKVGEEYWEILRDSLRVDEGLQRLAQERTRQARTTAEKVSMLAAFVRDTVSYSGLQLGSHGLQPYTAAETLRLRFGDCKDHSLLLTQLLHSVGIQASMALCNVDTDVPGDLPSLGAFNHMIVAVPMGVNAWDFIDCTNKRLGYTPGQIPWLLGGRKALLLGRNAATEAKLVTIPAVTRPERILVKRRVEQSDGDRLKISETISCDGLAACELRWRIEQSRETPSVAFLGRLFGLDRTLYPMKEATVENLNAQDKRLIITLNYEARKGVQQLGNSLALHLPYSVETKLLDPEEMLPEKITGAYFEYQLEVQTETQLVLPKGYSMAAEVPPGQENQYLTRKVEREFHSDHTVLRATFTRRITQLLSRQEYEEYQSMLVAGWSGLETLPLVSNSQAAPALADKER